MRTVIQIVFTVIATIITAYGADTVLVPARMSTGRARHSATRLQNGDVLLAGGLQSEGCNSTVILRTAELFSPADNSFHATGSMATARYHHTATLLPNGKVLIAGGFAGETACALTPPPLSSAELYDPATGTFSPTGSMSFARGHHVATLLQDGTVLIVGGQGDIQNPVAAEIYDPATGTFTVVGSLGTARGRATATLLPDGEVLIAGGTSAPTAELFDPTTRTFSATGNMTTARSSHTATLLRDGTVFFAGGGASGIALASTEIYDPAMRQFSPSVSLPAGRSEHTQTSLRNEQVVIFGGIDQAPQSTGVAVDVASGTSSIIQMVDARLDHTATLLDNGDVLIVGGVGGAEVPKGTAELFASTTPPPGQRRRSVRH